MAKKKRTTNYVPLDERCKETVYRRDTYRYTGRTKGGFELHYQRGQCDRRATHGEYCWQHAKMHEGDN